MNNQESLEEQWESIREALKSKRSDLGLPLRELAKAVGTSKSSVWSWENGYKIPSALNLIKWINALGGEVVFKIGS